MATRGFTPEELRQLHDLARQWAKIVSRRAFGDDGPGLDVDFRAMEQIAIFEYIETFYNRVLI